MLEFKCPECPTNLNCFSLAVGHVLHSQERTIINGTNAEVAENARAPVVVLPRRRTWDLHAQCHCGHTESLVHFSRHEGKCRSQSRERLPARPRPFIHAARHAVSHTICDRADRTLTTRNTEQPWKATMPLSIRLYSCGKRSLPML